MVRSVLVISALLAAVPALAGPREDTLAGISRCAGLPDDRTFLDCLYGAAQPMRARLGLPPAPASQQHLVPPPVGYMPPPMASAQPAYVPPAYVPPPPAAPAPRVASAVPSRPVPKVGVVDSFLGNDPTANWMEAFSFDGHGLFTVTFSNGQVWRQDAGDTARAHWTGRASDFSIKLAIDASGKRGQLMVRGDAATYQVHKLR